MSLHEALEESCIENISVGMVVVIISSWGKKQLSGGSIICWQNCKANMYYILYIILKACKSISEFFSCEGELYVK